MEKKLFVSYVLEKHRTFQFCRIMVPCPEMITVSYIFGIQKGLEEENGGTVLITSWQEIYDDMGGTLVTSGRSQQDETDGRHKDPDFMGANGVPVIPGNES